MEENTRKKEKPRGCKAASKDTQTSTKATGTRLKERWLLTRKTWRYMSDAGKKLFPDGTHPNKKEDIPRVEEHFQRLNEKCEEYILWNPHRKKSQAEDYPDTDDEGKCEGGDGEDPSDISRHPYDPSGRDCRIFPTAEAGWGLPSEIYNHLLRSYGANTLNRVASKLLEEQLMEEDEFGCDDDDGEYIEVDGRTMRSIGTQTEPYLDVCVQTDHDGTAEDDVNVGAETRAETEAAFARQRALMQERIYKEDSLSQARGNCQMNQQQQQLISANRGEEKQNEHQQTSSSSLTQMVQTQYDLQLLPQEMTFHQQQDSNNLSSYPTQDYPQQHPSQSQPQQQPQQPQQPQQRQHGHQTLQQQPQQYSQEIQQQIHQRPVLKKFWARRESLTAKTDLQHLQQERIGRIVITEKEKETAQQKGMVAAKLASLEATSPPGASASAPSSASTVVVFPKQQETLTKTPDKKKQQNVFKLGLKCDIDGQQGFGKVSIEKAAMDKFKTINYDKTLRNIKSKWVPSTEEEEYIKSLERENELERERVKEMKLKEKERVKMKEKEERIQEKERERLREKEKEKLKEKEKKKKKARSIQVGEPLPQFILNSFRINSPVEIIHATRRRLRRFSSKAESISGSESSIPPSGMISPRFSICILDDQGNRDLVVSEAEAYKLSQMGIPFVYKRASLEIPLEMNDFEGGIKDSGTPQGQGPHHFQRSLSAVQASGHMSQLLYHLRASRLANPIWGGSSHLGGRTSDRAQRLTQSLLQYFLPTVMQRSRASGGGGQTSRLVAKRIWRTRSKSQSRASAGTTSIWTPTGNCTWMSVTGRVSTLEQTSLLQLSELERLSLQRVSTAKLQALNLGCQVKIPKETSTSTPNKKRRPYLLKRKALSSGLFEGKKEENKGPNGGLVFGLSLNKCLENERLRLREASEREALSLLAAASSSSVEDGEGGSLSRKSSQAGSHASFTSLLEGAKQSTTGSLESLNLERKRPSLGGGDVLIGGGSPTSLDLLTVDCTPQVPALVNTCCKFLEGHGLHTLGIFRVSSSKKRVRQLREEFDSGKEIILTQEHCPHDIATLLKEFFRDLPEPLLTRELYEPLLCTQKIRNRRLQFEALQYIVQLLPTANRDTLYALLTFLTTVADHSSDSENESGPGNKMDSSNLATLFAPNILHQIKPGSDTLSTSEMAAQAEERIDVINVVRYMIDHNKDLFEVTPELLDETYQHLMDTHPEALDILLRRRCTGPDELDLEVDTSSSVFEGSDASSPLPRSPTDQHDFEKLRSGIIMDETDISRRETQTTTVQDGSIERTRRRRRHEEEETRRHYLEKRSSAGDGGVVEERGWFRRREKSGSRELERGLDQVTERTRWFRRREKTSPKTQEEKLMSRQGSDKTKDKSSSRQDAIKSRERFGSQDSAEIQIDRRFKLLTEQEKLRVPEPSVRRLSSPEIDTYGVITASLKIPVPLQQQSSLAFAKETDIPYIEDCNLSEEAKLRLKEGASSSASRQRTGSNDSFLGQPITGSISFQPLSKKDGDKQSHDSVLSSSSMGVFTMSPSERNTPSSDFHCASGASSPNSGAFSPPLWLSPDSGTPGFSPPSSPPPQRRRGRRREEYCSSKPNPLTHSATHTFGSKPTAPPRTRDKVLRPQQQAPLGRSRTTDVIKVEETIGVRTTGGDIRTRDDGSRTRVVGSKGNVEKEANKKYTRRKYTGERHHTGHLPDITSLPTRVSTAAAAADNNNSTQQLWKRWEIIASDPTEPETFV